MTDLSPEQEQLRKELHERVDLSFVEFFRFTREFTIPQIKHVIDVLVADHQPGDGSIKINLTPDKPKTKIVWTGAGPMEVEDNGGDSPGSPGDT
jgi:hypothetical protein